VFAWCILPAGDGVGPTGHSPQRIIVMATSKKDASLASKLLSNPKTPKKVKSVAASDLAQAKKQSSKKK
jgi:hypothetical protein